MTWLLQHLRNKLVAGALAAVPVAIVVYVAYWIETNTKVIADAVGLKVPGLGVLIVIAGVYLLGLVVTSFLGKFFLGLVNAILKRVPGLGVIYQAWKDLLVIPPNQAGMFHQPVMLDVGEGRSQLGFTSGRALLGDPTKICVYLPSIPNPLTGDLVVVPREACTPLKMSVEEALKYHVSSGNYLPPALVGCATRIPARTEPDAQARV